MDRRILVCPESRLGVERVTLAEAEDAVGGALRARSGPPGACGATATVLLREDHACVYPVVDGIPVLLVPEMLTPPGREREFDLAAPRYDEAYEEMEHYNAEARRQTRLLDDGNLATLEESSSMLRKLARTASAGEAERASFPAPRELWIDAPYDSESQYDAYRHLAPLSGKRVLQVGGEGGHAVKFLQAGAAEAFVLSPMLGELEFAHALAHHHGVADRLRCVAGVAEEMPFRDGSFDAIYAGGCAHHWVTEVALPECARVLAPGGRFAAVDPWRSPGYALGTRLLGKREPDVHCRPLTEARVQPFYAAFDRAGVVHHGALTRYLVIALAKLGLELDVPAASRIQRLDDRFCSVLPPLRRFGSSVALLGSRSPTPSAA